MLDFIDSENLWECLPNIEPMTLLARTASSTPGTADTFVAYSLYHVARKKPDRKQESAGGASLATELCDFDIYVDDLQNTGLPLPTEPWLTFLLFDQTAGSYTGTLASGNAVVTGIASTAGLLTGMGVVGTGITPGSTIQVVASTSITLSQPATANGTFSLTAGVAWVVDDLQRSVTKAKWPAKCSRAR